MLAYCFRAVNIFAHDTRDANGGERFMQWTPMASLQVWETPSTLQYPITILRLALYLSQTMRYFDKRDGWYWEDKPKNTGWGLDCCSSQPISWHSLKAPYEHKHMQLLDYLLLEVNPKVQENIAAHALQSPEVG